MASLLRPLLVQRLGEIVGSLDHDGMVFPDIEGWGKSKSMQLNAVRLVAVARWQISDFRNRWFGSEVQVHGTRWESHSLEADWGGCWKRPGDEMKGVPKTVTRSCGTCPFSGLSGVWIIDPLVWSTLNLVAWNTCRHSNLIKLVDGKSPGVSQPGICNRKRS